MTLTEIVQALQELNLRPRRRFGQNYLHDQNLARIIVDAARIGPKDTVVEIGPGLGALTEHLLGKGARTELIEADARAAGYLKTRFPGADVRHEDALKADFPKGKPSGWICIGNLPYSVASRLIVGICEREPRPVRMVFTVQKEVAGRLTAKAGIKDFGLLTLLVQPFYAIKTIRRLPPSVFFPEPEVESAVVLFERNDRSIDNGVWQDYGTLVKKAFQHRRKTLGAIFGRDLPVGLNPKTRPAEVPLKQWLEAAGIREA